MTSVRSILAYNHDEDKIAQLDDHQLLACAGDNSSRVAFTEYVTRNLSLVKMRSGRALSNVAAANFIRNQLAQAIRSRGGAYQVNSLFASIDESGPSLYFLDYLGTLQEVPFAAHGYSATFVTSQLDAANTERLTEVEAVNLVKQCCDQLARRFLINLPLYNIKILRAGQPVEEVRYSPKFTQAGQR